MVDFVVALGDTLGYLRRLGMWFCGGAMLLALAALAFGGCSDESPASASARCEEWVSGLEDGSRDASDDVVELVQNAYDTEFLCFEADRRGALSPDGTVEPTRLIEVIRCSSDREDCAPRELDRLLRSDARVGQLSVIARLVLFQALIPVADYDGVAELRAFKGEGFGDEVRGAEAIAILAGTNSAEARAALRNLARSRIVQIGKLREFERSCAGSGALLGSLCDETVVAIDRRLVRRAQRLDR
jgi:hypothetical protein